MLFVRTIMAASHYLGLGIGLGSLFVRGRCFKSLIKEPSNERVLSTLFLSDYFWGFAAILWMVTGLARVLGGLDKETTFYLGSGMFWLKMTLFAIVWILEIFPMWTLIVWRIKKKKGQWPVVPNLLPRLFLLNHIELALIFIIPFVASAMARGIWMF